MNEVSEIPNMNYDYDPLVALQLGRAGVVPLFCIAGAGASVSSFFELAQKMPGHVPLLGLQARGLDGASEPFGSVEAAAHMYFNAVRTIWPGGPYRILGHSFGGWVAFELAGLLRRQGCQVEALFLVDSEAPHDCGRVATQLGRVDALEHLVDLYNLLLTSRLRVSRKDFEKLDQRAQILLLEQELMRMGVLPQNAPRGLLEGVVAVFEANLRTTYHGDELFDGTLWLANAAESSENIEARVAGWRRNAVTVCCATLPGNHLTMLLGENAAHLAEWIGRTLPSLEGLSDASKTTGHGTRNLMESDSTSC
jgi:thioesterase domain-containing protein